MTSPLSSACDRLERAIEAGTPPDTEDLRAVLRFVRAQQLPAAATRRNKTKHPDSGLLPAEREALRAGLLKAGLPGDWPLRKRYVKGVGHLFVSGELGHSLRIYQRRALYLVHRTGFLGEHDLGVFTGEGWVERLVAAVVETFDRISPPNAGWTDGQRARDRTTGQVFEVRLVRNLAGPPRHWADPTRVELFDPSSRRHMASDCEPAS